MIPNEQKQFNSNASLMAHQQEGLSFFNERPQAGLFFEQGLGKTLTVLERLQQLKDQNQNAFPVLIICPLSVVSVWGKESRKFGYDFRFQSLTGSYHERLGKLEKDADVYVINYDGLRVIEAPLLEKKFATVVCDESHRIKERKSTQTQIALKLSEIAEYRIILSGTPVTKSPEDIWTQIEFIRPGYLGNFFAFRNRYIDFRKMMVRTANGIQEVKKAVRFKNLKELNSKLDEVCLRRTKAECLDLPSKVYKRIYCELGGDQLRAYQDIKHGLQAILEDKTISVSTAAAKLQKLQQVCQGFVYDESKHVQHFKENTKLKALKETLEDIGPEKSIVFCWFKADVDLLKAELSKTHTVIFYEGDAEQRGKLVDTFQNFEGPCLFLAQIETAKEGITLTAAGNVIYYGNSWNYGTRMQSEDRAHRTGQTKTVVYYDITIPMSVDEYVLTILQNKGAMADKVTGDSLRLAKIVAGLETI